MYLDWISCFHNFHLWIGLGCRFEILSGFFWHLFRGAGILFMQSFACGLQHLGSNNISQTKKRSCTASCYIANPLLIDGRKIDLRVYVLVTELSPLKGFIFREGLVRFCGGLYDENQLEELGAHVSNNAVQTKTQRHASGQNWTLEQLWDHLRTHGAEGNKAPGKNMWMKRSSFKLFSCKKRVETLL